MKPESISRLEQKEIPIASGINESTIVLGGAARDYPRSYGREAIKATLGTSFC